MSKDILRRLPFFANLSEHDLNQLYQSIEIVAAPAGAAIIEEGGPGDALYVILDGEFEVTRRTAHGDVVLNTPGPGDFVGETALLERGPRLATVRALRDSQVLRVPRDAFDHLLQISDDARHAVLSAFASRLRGMEGSLRQSQKMAALGQLSAGLAHELNNPAAALERGTQHLQDLLARWQRLTVEVGALMLDAAQTHRLATLRAALARTGASGAALDPLARGELEDEIQTWLEEHGVAEAWDLAPVLVDLRWDTATLATVADGLTEAQGAVVVPWLGLGLAAPGLLDEMNTSARRITEIVRAMQSYTYLDRGTILAVDVHEGLESTLVILRHKLKQGVTIRRAYSPTLPRIQAFGSELNQVWTNIIDNAIDAMQGQGELTLHTVGHAGRVVVEITDTGPGIPPDIRPRLFEPFFTTKPPGSGAGLGLHIAYNIVVHKHRGTLSVTSEPGATCFQVSLPLDPFADRRP